jgi:hypothetical protein
LNKSLDIDQKLQIAEEPEGQNHLARIVVIGRM